MAEHDGSGTRPIAVPFNPIAKTYDGIRFFQRTALRLLERAALEPGTRVLDVATGTGFVAIEAARAVGPTGKVIGTDVAAGMLAQARRKADAARLTNVEFAIGDAERLDFPDASFDVVLCASSLFFVRDMSAAVREWHRVLVAGGRAGFTSFGPTFLQPLARLWAEQMETHGVTMSFPPTHRLSDPAVCAALLRDCGFATTDVSGEQLGYYLGSAESRWDEIRAGLEGVALDRLDPQAQERVKAEHLDELGALVTDEGLWVDVPVNFAFGVKTAS
jgi:ubiquinone/menaquinone biosynthesis C-methylase UbiE